MSSLPKLQVTFKIVSKAKSMFYFFKPMDLVQGEKFDLILTFKNLADNFSGGFCQLWFRYSDSSMDNQQNFEIPPIAQNDTWTITFKEKVIPTSGHCGLVFDNQHYYSNQGQKQYDYLYDFQDTHLTRKAWISIIVISKEELYQKYAVNLAIVAIVISFIAIVISLFR